MGPIADQMEAVISQVPGFYQCIPVWSDKSNQNAWLVKPICTTETEIERLEQPATTHIFSQMLVFILRTVTFISLFDSERAQSRRSA